MAEMMAIFGISLVLAGYAGFKYVKMDVNNYASYLESNQKLGQKVAEMDDTLTALVKADNSRAQDLLDMHEHLQQVRKNQMWLHNKIAPKKKVVAAPTIPTPPPIPHVDTFKKIKGKIKELSK